MKYSICKRKIYEKPVQNGLAVTPAQMAELTAKGVPITASNLGMVFDDGVSKLDYDVPPEHTRGVDINDLWNLKQDIRKKLRKGLAGYKESEVENG